MPDRGESGAIGATDRRWLLLALLLALLPLVLLLARIPAELAGEGSVGDLASFEIGVLESARGERFVGQVSRFGFYQLGPAHYWVQVPLYVVTGGRHDALAMTTLLLNWVAMLGIAFAVFRWFGSRSALLALPVVAIPFARFYEVASLVNPWCQYVNVLCAAWFVLVAAAVSSGRRTLWPLLIGLGSFLVQGYGSTLHAVASVLALTGAVELWRTWSRLGSGVAAGGPRRGPRTWVWAVAVGVVLWCGPFLDAATTSPSNLDRLSTYYGRDVPSRGASPQALRESFARHVAGPWLSLAGDVRGNSPYPLDPDAVRIGTRIAFAQLALLLLAVAVERRRRPFAAWVGVVCLVMLLGAWLAARGLDGALYPYIFFWLSGCAAVGWLLVVATTFELSAIALCRAWPSLRRLPAPSRPVLLAALAAVFAVVVALRPPPIPHLGDPAVPAIAAAIEEHLGVPDAPVRLVMHDLAWMWGFGVLIELDRARRPVTVVHVQRGRVVPNPQGLQQRWRERRADSVVLHLWIPGDAREPRRLERVACHPLHALDAAGHELCILRAPAPR